MNQQPLRAPWWFALVIAGAALIMALSLSVYGQFVQNTLAEDTYTMLIEISEKEASLIRQKNEQDLQQLHMLADILVHTDAPDRDVMTEILRTCAQNGLGNRVVAIRPDGYGITSDGLSGNLWQDSTILQQALAQEELISDVVPSVLSRGREVVVLSVRVVKDGKTMGVLAAVRNLSDYHSLMSLSDFGGQGEAYVIRRDGTAVIWPDTAQSLLDFSPVDTFAEDKLLQSLPALRALKQAAEAGDSGVMTYQCADGRTSYVSFLPLGVHDWVLLNAVPVSLVSNRADHVIRFTMAIGGLILALLLLVSLAAWGTRRANARLLRQYAYFDLLTGLPNAQSLTQFCDRLPDNTTYAFILLQIENMRRIFQIFGDATGENLLRELSAALRAETREKECAGRIYDGTFGLFLRYDGLPRLEDRVTRLFASLDKVKVSDGPLTYDYRCTFTGAVYPIQPGEDISLPVLQRRAEFVCAGLPLSESSRWGFYSDDLRDVQELDAALARELPRALREREFIPYYQPQYNMETQSFCGAELLARWQHPTRGLLPPSRFVPLLESAGNILDLDMLMLEAACRCIRGWLDRGLPCTRLSVNIARLNIHRADLIPRLTGIVKKYDVPPSLLILELTETAIYENAERVIELMHQLKELGFIIGMDDFGSGYSSLNMLHQFPVDEIKIDKEFLSGSENDERMRTILTHIVHMAANLDAIIMAEGIEDRAQADFLKSVGCMNIQGYYFARPMPESDFISLLYPDREGEP